MKTKLIFSVLCFMSTVFLSAQLKVRTDGCIQTGYTGYPNLYLGNSGYVETNGDINGQWGFEVDGTSLNIWKPWPSYNAGNNKLWLDGSGNIGIGKIPTPNAALDVAGDIYSSGLKLTSDERLKNDIEPLTNKFMFVYKLNGKSYKKHLPDSVLTVVEQKDKNGNLISGKNFPVTKKTLKETAEFGFIAQELKNVYPELVSQDTLGYYYVNYIGLIPIIVEALKDQKAQIDAQTAQISALLAKLEDLSSTPKKANASIPADISETDALTYPVLEQNIPNPFNATTSIGYSVPNSIVVANIYVYDMNGTQLKSYTISQRGKGNIIINGSELSAGMYLYALIADGKVIDTKRMILTK